jgi:uncharacterized protein (TIGR03435 family)
MRKPALAPLFFFLLFFAIGVHGQAQPSRLGPSHEKKMPAYDVVSIKPSNSTANNPSILNHMDLYMASDISLRRLLQDAYNIRPDFISGIPSHIDAMRFDIAAKILDPNVKMLDNLTEDQWRAMRRAMLSEYFHLNAHTVLKTLPIDELVITRKGAKFKPSDGKGDTGMSVDSSGHLTGHNVPMSRLATALSDQLQRAVIDKTELTGSYDFTLRWSTDASEADGNAGPSLYSALQEQLGLKLQSAKGSVETLVVDHVEVPSEN